MKPFCISVVAALGGSAGSAVAPGSDLSCSVDRMLLFLRRSSKSADDAGAIAAMTGRSPRRKRATGLRARGRPFQHRTENPLLRDKRKKQGPTPAPPFREGSKSGSPSLKGGGWGVGLLIPRPTAGTGCVRRRTGRILVQRRNPPCPRCSAAACRTRASPGAPPRPLP